MYAGISRLAQMYLRLARRRDMALRKGAGVVKRQGGNPELMAGLAKGIGRKMENLLRGANDQEMRMLVKALNNGQKLRRAEHLRNLVETYKANRSWAAHYRKNNQQDKLSNLLSEQRLIKEAGNWLTGQRPPAPSYQSMSTSERVRYLLRDLKGPAGNQGVGLQKGPDKELFNRLMQQIKHKPGGQGRLF